MIAKKYNGIEWVYVCMRECVWHSREWCLRMSISIYIPRRYIGLLLYKLRFMCPILASYVDILILKNYN